MPSHFEDIGYTFEKPGDLARLYDANAERVEVYDLGTGCSLHLLSPSKDCELLVCTDDLDDRIIFYAPYSDLMRESILRVDRLIESDSSIGWGLLRVEDPYDDLDIPFNVELVLNDLDVKEMEGGLFYVDLLAFAESVELFGSADDMCEKTGLDEEALIPCGLLPPDGDAKEFTESAHVIMSAVINEVERLTNPLTGLEFYRLWTGCLGIYTSALAPVSAFEREPEVGDHIHGVFFLMAKLSDEEIYDDELYGELADQFGVKVPAGEEDLGRIEKCLAMTARGERGFFVVNYTDAQGRQTFIQSSMTDDMMGFVVEFNVPGPAKIRMADGTVRENGWSQYAKEFGSSEEALEVFRAVLTDGKAPDLSDWKDITEVILSESDELAYASGSRRVS